jgi:hypothetical protein
MQSSKAKSWSVGAEITHIEGVYMPVTFLGKYVGKRKRKCGNGEKYVTKRLIKCSLVVIFTSPCKEVAFSVTFDIGISCHFFYVRTVSYLLCMVIMHTETLR